MSPINADNPNEIEEATKQLTELFKKFEEENEPFCYNKVVKNEEGFRTTILVDFGAEDFERGNWYLATVSAAIEDQPVDRRVAWRLQGDTEWGVENELGESSAVRRAMDVIREAAESGLSHYNDLTRPDARIEFRKCVAIQDSKWIRDWDAVIQWRSPPQ